jgi:xanthine dehydrogenase small subunit
LKGQAFSAATFEGAATAVVQDFQPIDDWRGSASYRLQAAANLLRRVYWRIAQPEAAVEVEAL